MGGRVRSLGQSPGRLSGLSEGLGDFLELCLSGYIQALLELPRAGTGLKWRPFGTDLGDGSFRVSTLKGSIQET